MYEEKVVARGYIKLLALSIGHLETEIIMEKNTNNRSDIEVFKEKYDEIKGVFIFVIHMDFNDDIMFSDYQKVSEEIHCLDYLLNLLTKKNGRILERNDIQSRPAMKSQA